MFKHCNGAPKICLASHKAGTKQKSCILKNKGHIPSTKPMEGESQGGNFITLGPNCGQAQTVSPITDFQSQVSIRDVQYQLVLELAAPSGVCDHVGVLLTTWLGAVVYALPRQEHCVIHNTHTQMICMLSGDRQRRKRASASQIKLQGTKM